MITLVVDDNREYAEVLGDRHIEPSLAQERLETEIASAGSTVRVLINRELKLPNYLRLSALGEEIYQRTTWKYPSVPFYLYSFRLPPPGAQLKHWVRLPIGVQLPEQLPPERLDCKIGVCLDYIQSAFAKVQHALEVVDPVQVNLVRLLYGAVLARRVTDKRSIDRVLGLVKPSDQAVELLLDFTLTAESLAALLRQRGDMAGAETTGIPNRMAAYRRILVVDDDRVGDKSPWAEVLGIVYGTDGYRFEWQLPSAVLRCGGQNRATYHSWARILRAQPHAVTGGPRGADVEQC